ncbi:hypothetical protein [Lacticaseibacillus pantheris]|uniref:hypothetical protein n=1 Tax=Lacticaseibacillus pantheris TaxID=171523 RepID=UPI0006D1F0AD|nr:hypothetical protein [Lacticaseibacillus pantheris]
MDKSSKGRGRETIGVVTAVVTMIGGPVGMRGGLRGVSRLHHGVKNEIQKRMTTSLYGVGTRLPRR